MPSLFHHYYLAGESSYGSASPPPSGSQADTYAAEVLSHSTVAFYKMSEQSGTTMTDSSSTGNNGSYSGSPTLGVSGPFDGATGVAFSSALSQYASAVHSAALDFGATEDFSMVLWFRMTASWPASSQWLIGRNGNGESDCYEIYVVGGYDNGLSSRLFDTSNNATHVATPTTTDLNDSTWHMVAVTMDRSANGQWYLDGSAYGSGTDITAADSPLNDTGSFYLARRGAGSYWSGEMCMVSIHDVLLSAADISALWAAAGM